MKKLKLMNALQLLGRSLMLPITVLPIAGILLRMGQPDLLNIAAISAAGSGIFENLALIFAIGVAIGMASDNHGVSALAGATAFLVLNSTLKILDPDINMGVLGGIICGVMAGLYYNRFKDIILPQYIAFFGGRRFIPIISGSTAIALAYLFNYIWPPIQYGINQLGALMIESGSIGLFFYGLLNRLLIVTGLHHIINNLIWFQLGSFTTSSGKVIHGDLSRFFMGDPTAGTFMAGMFPVMMFGLPAVALAMYRCALPERRPQIAGLLFSLAFTSFLTGITEPIEFSFMFLSPLLYVIHAVLTGLSMVIMGLLHVKLGFTFSAGVFDYVLSYSKSTNGWLLFPVGAGYFIFYYYIFIWAIRHFNLKVIGRTEAAPSQDAAAAVTGNRGRDFVMALGGTDNLISTGACTTRLRLVTQDQNRIDEARLKQLGAMAVMKLRDGNVQVILGPVADNIAEDMRQYMRLNNGQTPAAAPVAKDTAAATAPTAAPLDDQTAADWLKALGGKENLRNIRAIATTRLRLEVVNEKALNPAALQNLGVAAVEPLGNGLVHLIFYPGQLPASLAAQIQ